jgi:hypothetical protein
VKAVSRREWLSSGLIGIAAARAWGQAPVRKAPKAAQKAIADDNENPDESDSGTPGPKEAVPEGAIPPVTEGEFAGLRWRLSYQFDELGKRCRLLDFAMPTPKFGLASLVIVNEDTDRAHGALLVTRDGGEHWAIEKSERDPMGVAVIGETHGWVVYAGKLAATSDAGASWTRTTLPDAGLMQVHFDSESEGWVYGRGKAFYHTADGGESWTPAPESLALALKSPETYLRSMAMLPSGAGLIAGDSTARSPAGGVVPDWMAPQQAAQRAVVPGTALLYETHDHGKSWASSASSTFGTLRRVRLGAGRPVAVFQYGEGFGWPAELYEFDPQRNEIHTLLRRKELVIADVLPLAGGGLLVAGSQPAGRLRNSPVPSKIRVLWTPDRTKWYEMKVDYRATGHEATFAASADGTLWLATDEGAVVRLAK